MKTLLVRWIESIDIFTSGSSAAPTLRHDTSERRGEIVGYTPGHAVVRCGNRLEEVSLGALTVIETA